VDLVDLYPDLPAISLLNTFQFYTKRAANADNKDWFLKFLLTGFDINNNI